MVARPGEGLVLARLLHLEAKLCCATRTHSGRWWPLLGGRGPRRRALTWKRTGPAGKDTVPSRAHGTGDACLLLQFRGHPLSLPPHPARLPEALDVNCDHGLALTSCDPEGVLSGRLLCSCQHTWLRRVPGWRGCSSPHRGPSGAPPPVMSYTKVKKTCLHWSSNFYPCVLRSHGGPRSVLGRVARDTSIYRVRGRG